MKDYQYRKLAYQKYKTRVAKARLDNKEREKRKKLQTFKRQTAVPVNKMHQIGRKNTLVKKGFIPRNHNAMIKRKYYAYIDISNRSFPASFFYDSLIGFRCSILFFHFGVDFTRK